MHFLDLTLPSLEENLALDEALLVEAEAGRSGEVLRIWEWPSAAVVLGAGGRLADDANEDTCGRDGIPIVRRASGGGTVLLGPGCLLYSLVLAYDRGPALAEVIPSYHYILETICDVLRDRAPGIEIGGSSDLAVDGIKISGNAQQRKRRHLMHHGTLLYEFDAAQVGHYLHEPGRQPAYRGGREHTAFLGNLPIRMPELIGRLREAWQADHVLPVWPREVARQLVAEKYSRVEWIRRR